MSKQTPEEVTLFVTFDSILKSHGLINGRGHVQIRPRITEDLIKGISSKDFSEFDSSKVRYLGKPYNIILGYQ